MLKYEVNNVHRGYKDYEKGFGRLRGDFWLGLENMHRITARENYAMRVEMVDKMGNRAYTEYAGFR